MAAKPEIGGKLTLDGEKEFKSAIADINKNLRVLGSEMSLASAQYSDGSDKAKELTEKNTVLNKSIEEQKQKIQVIKDVLAKSNATFGESANKTKDWQISLNKAEAELAKMTTEVKKNEDAMKVTTKSATSLGDVFRTIGSTIGLNTNPAFDEMSTKLDGVNASGAALVGVLGAIVTGLVDSSLKLAEQSKEIVNLSQTTGLSIQAYQEWDIALKNVGGSMEQAAGDFVNLSEKILDASKGTGEAAEMFSALGIRVTGTGGKLKSQEVIFGEMVTKLQGMRDITERNAIASALLGTTGEKLGPILNMTAKELQNVKDNAKEMGLVMSDQTVYDAAELADTMKELDNQGKAVQQSFGKALIPILTVFGEILTKIPTQALVLAITLGGVITTAVLAVKTFNEFSTAAGTIGNFFSATNVSGMKTTGIILGVVAALVALGIIIAVIMGKSNDLSRATSDIGTSVQAINGKVNSAGMTPRYANGTNYHPGGQMLVGENGPELIEAPSGTIVYDANETRKMSGTNNYYTITVQADDLQQVADVVRLFENLKSTKKAGAVMA